MKYSGSISPEYDLDGNPLFPQSEKDLEKLSKNGKTCRMCCHLIDCGIAHEEGVDIDKVVCTDFKENKNKINIFKAKHPRFGHLRWMPDLGWEKEFDKKFDNDIFCQDLNDPSEKYVATEVDKNEVKEFIREVITEVKESYIDTQLEELADLIAECNQDGKYNKTAWQFHKWLKKNYQLNNP